MTQFNQDTAAGSRAALPGDAAPPGPARGVDLESVRRVYRRYAPFYDATFGWMTGYCQRRLVRGRNFRTGSRVLEIGVGTGLSLPLYPSGVRVVGVDVSPAMLQRAQMRKARLGLDNVELHLCDAEHSGFAHGSFDCVMLMFVLSVTPNPQGLLAEACRLCRPGGDVYVLNHFEGASGFGLVERIFARYASRVGFRSDLPLTVATEAGTQVAGVESFPPLGFFKLVHLRA